MQKKYLNAAKADLHKKHPATWIYDGTSTTRETE